MGEVNTRLPKKEIEKFLGSLRRVVTAKLRALSVILKSWLDSIKQTPDGSVRDSDRKSVV